MSTKWGSGQVKEQFESKSQLSSDKPSFHKVVLNIVKEKFESKSQLSQNLA